MITLDNHRKLKPDEIILKGDFVKRTSFRTSDIFPANRTCIGRRPCNYLHHEFWRRKHTKKVVQPAIKPTVKQSAIIKNDTIVEFYYNDTLRRLVVIKMDDKYLKGLEITVTADNKQKYQFKSFLLGRIDGPIRLIYFGPVAYFGPGVDFTG